MVLAFLVIFPGIAVVESERFRLAVSQSLSSSRVGDTATNSDSSDRSTVRPSHVNATVELASYAYIRGILVRTCKDWDVTPTDRSEISTDTGKTARYPAREGGHVMAKVPTVLPTVFLEVRKDYALFFLPFHI